MRRNTCEKRAVSDATIRSQASAMLQPMPTVGPRTAAITGFSMACSVRRKCVAAALHPFSLGAQSASLHAADIGAGAERAALAGDDDRAHVLIETKLLRVVAQLGAHLMGQRVQLLRPVEHDLRHRPLDDQIDRHRPRSSA